MKRTHLAAVLALVLLVGTAARLVPWRQVFTPDGVLLAGTDTWYHALRAEQTVRNYPHTPWFDPWMSFPEGAPVIWPPLFDQTIATLAVALGGTQASSELVRSVAAGVPVLFGILILPLVAAIVALLVDAETGLVAALVVALLPAQVYYGEVGRPDHHVAEPFFFCWIALAFLLACKPGERGISRRWPWHLFLGLGITHAFWNWMGSGLNLAFLAAVVGVWYLASSMADPVVLRGVEALWRGSLIAMALLAVTILLWAPEGALASTGLHGVTAFHIALVGWTAAFGGILHWLARRRPESRRGARVLHVGLAAGIPLLALVATASELRGAVFHGLTFLGRANPWYLGISEMSPSFFSGNLPLRQEIAATGHFYGFGLLVMPAVAIPLVQRYRRSPQDRPAVLFLLLWGGMFLVLALLRRRFDNYFSVALAVWLAVGWRTVAEASAGWRNWRGWSRLLASAALGAVLFPALSTLLDKWPARPHPSAELFATLDWLREADPVPGREAVLAGWTVGHYIRYIARKPVVVNPFGTELGLEPLEDAAAFFLARDVDQAEDVLRRRRVGFVLLHTSYGDVAAFSGFAPPGSEPVIDIERNRWQGMSGNLRPAFWELIVTRLYFFDGRERPSRNLEALGGLRLLYESPTGTTLDGATAKRYKIFGVVPGARATVEAQAGQTVMATVPVRTNQGRDFLWRTSAEAGEDGRVTLRLPFASGANGAVVAAGPYRVSDPHRQAELRLTEAQVVAGTTVAVELR